MDNGEEGEDDQEEGEEERRRIGEVIGGERKGGAE